MRWCPRKPPEQYPPHPWPYPLKTQPPDGGCDSPMSPGYAPLTNHSAKQGHKPHRFQLTALETVAPSDNLDQHLILLPYRCDQHTTIGQLIQQFPGHLYRRRRHNNALKRTFFGPPHATVGMFEHRITNIQLPQTLPGPILQRLNTLHTEDFTERLGQHRSLVTGPGSQFQLTLRSVDQ